MIMTRLCYFQVYGVCITLCKLGHHTRRGKKVSRESGESVRDNNSKQFVLSSNIASLHKFTVGMYTVYVDLSFLPTWLEMLVIFITHWDKANATRLDYQASEGENVSKSIRIQFAHAETETWFRVNRRDENPCLPCINIVSFANFPLASGKYVWIVILKWSTLFGRRNISVTRTQKKTNIPPQVPYLEKGKKSFFLLLLFCASVVNFPTVVDMVRGYWQKGDTTSSTKQVTNMFGMAHLDETRCAKSAVKLLGNRVKRGSRCRRWKSNLSPLECWPPLEKPGVSVRYVIYR